MRGRRNRPKFAKRAESAEELRAAVEEHIPRGTARDDAVSWLSSEHIDVAEEEDALRFTLRGPARGPFVGVTWMVTVGLADGHVADVAVEQGLTGP